MPTYKDVQDAVRSSLRRRLRGLLGYALSLALAVATTVAHAAIWSSAHAAIVFGELVAQCPFLSSTDYPVHNVCIPFLANAATIAVTVAFMDARRHYRDWTWQTLLWLLLAALAAGLSMPQPGSRCITASSDRRGRRRDHEHRQQAPTAATVVGS